MRIKVLVVEDERSISGFIKTVLTANGYDVILAHTGAEAGAMAKSHCPMLVILDLGLPDMDGTELIRSIREWSRMPIIVVSARMHERDKVEALDLGADDFITKPFGTDELLARIRTALRHMHVPNEAAANDGVFRSGELVVDFEKHRIQIGGADVHLTQNEFRIVALLAQNAGKVMTYDCILRELWGPYAKSDNQILRVNMANIRRKLEKNPAEPKYIFTEVGVGYRMIDNGT